MRRSLLLSLLAAACLGLAAAGPCTELQADTQFPYCSELEAGVYSVAWKTDQDSLWLALDLTTDDPAAFMGFGLSEGGGMKGADIMVVAPKTDGSLQAQDLWSEAFAQPQLDAVQDVVLVAPLAAGQTADAGTPANVAAAMAAKPGRLRALLRRKLDTCDDHDLKIESGVPQFVIWSHGTNWPSYHGQSRGTSMLNFVPRDNASAVPVLSPPAQLPAGVQTLDIMMPNVTIPTNQTSYLCSNLQLPSDRKYHIIAQEGIINSPLVHHIILFSCVGPQPTEGQVYDCINTNPQCSTFTLGWAPGAGYVEYPEVAGFPFGTAPKEEEVPTWFSLQIHYNNPEGEVSENPDTSGIRIYYTPELRQHDMGVLTLTQINLVLPPGKSTVVAPASLCPGECTAKLSQPVTMLYTLLHMHQTGVSISTRHIRDGKELAPLGRRRVYDFNHQVAVPIPFETRELRPGDSLITQCTYNTVDRTAPTVFGQSTLNEMCFDFVIYYPRVNNVGACWSNPDVVINGAKVSTALCAPGNVGLSSGGGSPEEEFKMLMANGYITNSTWPDYQKNTDPQCSVSAQSLGV